MDNSENEGSQPPASSSRKTSDRINRSLVHREFIQILIDGKTASRCKICSFPMLGKNPTNLKTHLRSCSPEKLQKVEGTMQIVNLDYSV